MTYSNLKPQKVEKLKYEWWKATFKTFEKENHVILEQTKFTSLATTTTISISLLSQETTKSKPEQKKKKSHPKQPCKSLYPCTTISIKNETKIRQLPPPLLTSKQLQTNSLDNMRSWLRFYVDK